MSVGGIISGLIVGLVIGGLARLVLPGKQKVALWLTVLIGFVGALVGTGLARAVGVADTRGIDWIEIVLQVGVAALGIALVTGALGSRGARR